MDCFFPPLIFAVFHQCTMVATAELLLSLIYLSVLASLSGTGSPAICAASFRSNKFLQNPVFTSLVFILNIASNLILSFPNHGHLRKCTYKLTIIKAAITLFLYDLPR